MANRYIKRSSISAIIREMHIKSTRDVISHQLEDLLSKDKRYQSLARLSRNGNLCALLVHKQHRNGKLCALLVHCWYIIGTATVENGMQVLQKIKNGTTISSSQLTAEYTCKENEIRISKRYLHFCVHYNINPQQPRHGNNLSEHLQVNR